MTSNLKNSKEAKRAGKSNQNVSKDVSDSPRVDIESAGYVESLHGDFSDKCAKLQEREKLLVLKIALNSIILKASLVT